MQIAHEVGGGVRRVVEHALRHPTVPNAEQRQEAVRRALLVDVLDGDARRAPRHDPDLGHGGAVARAAAPCGRALRARRRWLSRMN